MAKNENMLKAKEVKNDEFYTQLDDISKEILSGGYDLSQFKDKIVLSNCDDPYESNFTLFFILKFRELKLKRFISTCYKGSPIALKGLFKRITPQSNGYVLDITEKDLPPDDKMDGKTIIKYLEKNKCIKNLNGDGDFRSKECIEYLKQADLIITNPPFSLFREYIAQLIEYNKKFLVIGNSNQVCSKIIFELLQKNLIWLGKNSVSKFFNNKTKELQKFGNICWFTNLDLERKHQDLILYKTYKGNEKDYPKYHNYPAINVDKIADIPKDYADTMGVPISIWGILNPDQFEICKRVPSPDLDSDFMKNFVEHGGSPKSLPCKLGYYNKDGIAIIPYYRVMIKNKKIDKEDK